MLGIKRGSSYGYSLYEFKVYANHTSEELSDVHFIKLKLRDDNGNILSDNFYWRSNSNFNYTGLNTIPAVKLMVSIDTVISKDGKHMIVVKITNPESSPAIAFGVRLQLVRASTGEQILPVFMDDNYFSLVKGETKIVTMECKAGQFTTDKPKLLVTTYSDSIIQSAEINVVDTPTAIGIIDSPRVNPEIYVYPNPVSGILYVQKPDKNDLLEIYNIFGVRLYRTNKNEIDLNGLKTGIYVAKILSKGINRTQTFLKL